jgi:hypothetical protein
MSSTQCRSSVESYLGADFPQPIPKRGIVSERRAIAFRVIVLEIMVFPYTWADGFDRRICRIQDIRKGVKGESGGPRGHSLFSIFRLSSGQVINLSITQSRKAAKENQPEGRSQKAEDDDIHGFHGITRTIDLPSASADLRCASTRKMRDTEDGISKHEILSAHPLRGDEADRNDRAKIKIGLRHFGCNDKMTTLLGKFLQTGFTG